MFKNMKISARLGVSSAVTLVLMVALIALSIVRMVQLDDTIKEVANAGVKSKLATDWVGQLSMQDAAFRTLALTEDAGDRKSLASQLAESARHTAADVDKLTSMVDSAAGKELLAVVMEARTKYLAVREKIEKLIDAGDEESRARAYAAIKGDLAPVGDKYRAEAAKLGALQENISSAAVLHAASAVQSSTTIMLVLGIVAVITTLGSGIIIARSITRPINHAVHIAHVVASGDLTQTIEVDSKDETGQLLTALRNMNAKLSGTVGSIRSGADTIKKEAQSIAQSVSQVATASTQQSGATSSMAAAVEELTVSVSHISDAAGQTQQNSETVAEKCSGGEVQVASAVESMKRIAQAVTEASAKIQGLEARAVQINAAAAAIKEIADQTNLLALNAAIEAARAGDQGRGFSVVADEVRKLAERTASTTAEIEEMVSAVQLETAESTAQMQHVLPLVQEGTRQADEVAVMLREISSSAQASLERVREVAHATREQSSASTSIAQQVEELAQTVEETSAAMQTTSDSAENMHKMAEQLDKIVGQFKV